MNRIVIILSADGGLEAVLSDSEIDIEVLKRGQHDSKIDIAEESLAEVEI